MISVQGIVGHRNHHQGEHRGGQQAEYQGPGQSGEDGVQGDGPGPQGRGGGGEQNRAHADGAALQDRLVKGKALFERILDEFDEHDGIADDDAAQGDHADHAGGRKKNRVGKAPNGFTGDQVQQPEAGHGADEGQGDGHHDQQRHEKGTGLHDQQDVDAGQCRGKGDAHVPEHPQGDLPLPLAGPLGPGTWGHGVGFELFDHVQHGFTGCPAGHLAGDENHPLQVFVVDGLLLGNAHGSDQFGQRDHGPVGAFYGDLAQLHLAGALLAGQDGVDHQRLALHGQVHRGRGVTAQGDAQGLDDLLGRRPRAGRLSPCPPQNRSCLCWLPLSRRCR